MLDRGRDGDRHHVDHRFKLKNRRGKAWQRKPRRGQNRRKIHDPDKQRHAVSGRDAAKYRHEAQHASPEHHNDDDRRKRYERDRKRLRLRIGHPLAHDHIYGRGREDEADRHNDGSDDYGR